MAASTVGAERPTGWMWPVATFLEPAAYLGAIAVGIGAMRVDVPFRAHLEGYAEFAAPAVFAAGLMCAAVITSVFSTSAVLMSTRGAEGRDTPQDALVATGVRGALWVGLCYSVGFLVLMELMGLLGSWLALLALPAALLVSFSFGAVGMVLTPLVRSGQDFDLVQLGLVALSLFSATFFPVNAYHGIWRVAAEVSPLYRAVVLLRELCTGLVTWNSLFSVVYLLVMGLAALQIAAWRSRRLRSAAHAH
jgi:lipooligosaccharide transport system permease protein